MVAHVSLVTDGPPASEVELLERAHRLAGFTLGDVARAVGVTVPADLRHAKGWVGQLVERALGATASSRAAPDFQELGVELKTLPLHSSGNPCESTFVCTIDLARLDSVSWERSLVRMKLARVLWMPVEGAREIPVSARRVGTALLWTPTAEEEAALRFDWEELAGMIGRGDVESITGHLGKYLQVRPKARSSRSRRRGIDSDGVAFAALPRGFYLRTLFTARIIRHHFC